MLGGSKINKSLESEPIGNLKFADWYCPYNIKNKKNS